ncbi:MAG: DUF4329 domain-containing protein [Pseudomonadota bacterium]
MNARTAPFVYGLMAIITAIIVVRAYLNVKGPDDFVVTVTQGEVQEFARAKLNELQQQSFAQDVELCGIIFEETGGILGATKPRIGDEASCGIGYFDEPGMRPIASFHTHASYSEKYDSEVPSVLDLESDGASGMDGYVATPGGRFWHIDANEPSARLICGPGCLDQDPKFKPCPADEPNPSYSLEQLRKRQSGAKVAC